MRKGHSYRKYLYLSGISWVVDTIDSQPKDPMPRRSFSSTSDEIRSRPGRSSSPRGPAEDRPDDVINEESWAAKFFFFSLELLPSVSSFFLPRRIRHQKENLFFCKWSPLILIQVGIFRLFDFFCCSSIHRTKNNRKLNLYLTRFLVHLIIKTLEN